MNRELPSFSAVRAFEAAARHLSFKYAAEELHVTQSAVSHQVKSLEEFLGTALFHREARGVDLTPEGQSYLTRISEVLDDLASATHAVRDQRTAGPLYIRSTPAFASRWLVPRLNDFNRLHPDIELHISTSLEPVSFTKDEVDVELRFGRTTSCDLHAESFLKSARFPVASPELLAQGPPLRRPEDLCRFVLLHDEFGDGWPQWFEYAGVREVAPDAGPRFAHCDLILRAAKEGQGVALAYGALAVEDLEAGKLKRLFDINLPSTVLYSLVCPKTNLDQPRVAAFRDWLTSTAALDNAQAATEPRLVEAVG